MVFTNPVSIVLTFGAVAAFCSLFGVLPFAARRRPGAAEIGSAYALAGGVMIGAGYLSMIAGLERGALAAVAGACAGVFATWLIERTVGGATKARRARVLLQSSLHAAFEGIAIGVAALVSLRFGVFVALALALHNVAEGLALTDLLCRQGERLAACAAWVLLSDLAQPLMAGWVVLLLPPAEAALAPALGFAAGTFLYLVLTELVPAAYARQRREPVALLLAAAAGLVVLLEEHLV